MLNDIKKWVYQFMSKKELCKYDWISKLNSISKHEPTIDSDLSWWFTLENVKYFLY